MPKKQPKIEPGLKLGRPAPPSAEDLEWGFKPAPELRSWVQETFLDDTSPLFNPAHAHLQGWNAPRTHFLWAGSGMERKGKRVVGLAEMPNFQCHRWQKTRQEQQLYDWFDEIPDFLITIEADFARECDDATFCALVEHELYHCGQATGIFGERVFKKDGEPKLTMRGHDAEEFVGVVERYGVGAAAGGVAELVQAAQRPPTIGEAKIVHACGTCALKLA